ncbi:MAG TPA: cell division protein FtsA [Fibrobacteres bacterium]|jgi:cell division protein FtsA|nr:cell division protein FtsA [Fibrobacterota bacterium]
MANPIVGLDIGTTKIGVIIGEIDPGGAVKIVGVGVSPSDGLRKGVVVNIEKTVKSIEHAVGEAELMAGVDVESVHVGIAGDHIKSINSRGVIAVSRHDNEITRQDVDRVIEAARAVAIPLDREMLHVIPQDYVVDDQPGIKDPVGMSGVRLEGDVHIVTGAITSVQNLYKSVEKAGLKVSSVVLEPLASAYAVLEGDERELGCAVIDIGGGTTDLIVFNDDNVRHTASIGLGGRNVTNDLAIGIRTPLERAEEIKRSHGTCLRAVTDGEYIPVPGVGGREEREVSRAVLASIIEPRMREIFTLALRELQKNHYLDTLGAGIVLTGGCARLHGAAELAEQVFGMPVKVGVPKGVGGLVDAVASPAHATGVGLVRYGAARLANGRDEDLGSDRMRGLFKKMSEWVRQYV